MLRITLPERDKMSNSPGNRTLCRLPNGLAAILNAQHRATKALCQANSACPLTRGHIQDRSARSQVEQRPKMLGQRQPARMKRLSQEQPCPVTLIDVGATRLHLYVTGHGGNITLRLCIL